MHLQYHITSCQICLHTNLIVLEDDICSGLNECSDRDGHCQSLSRAWRTDGTTSRLFFVFSTLPSSSAIESRQSVKPLYHLKTNACFTEEVLGVLCVILNISVDVFPSSMQNFMLTLMSVLSIDVIVWHDFLGTDLNKCCLLLYRKLKWRRISCRRRYNIKSQFDSFLYILDNDNVRKLDHLIVLKARKTACAAYALLW